MTPAAAPAPAPAARSAGSSAGTLLLAVRCCLAALLLAAAPVPLSASVVLACSSGALAPLLTPGRVLLLGEIHGSVEGPDLLFQAACGASFSHQVVVVALEVPAGESARLTTFLDSAGTPEDRAALLAGPFWQRTYQDGRSSAAMLELIEGLRRVRSHGRDVRVLAFDVDGWATDGQKRDDAMAATLEAAIAAAPADAVVLVYAGNVHARVEPGTPWNANYRPAGVALRNRWPNRVASVLLRNPPGEAWMCTTAEDSSCGNHELGGVTGEVGHVHLFPVPVDGYDGAIQLPSMTASPPAVPPAPRAGGET
jgi:hypothetical protein